MNNIELGRFSISLNVEDIEASLTFYQNLGFEVIEGGHMNAGFPDSETTKWRILKSDESVVGLFQGMFPSNIMTFNPTDVRAIQKHLKSVGIELTREVDEEGEGPASIVLVDPDGNQILIDQH